MGKTEFVSPEGLRVDGRRATETRRIRCKLGVFEQADGSAYFEQGNTRCLVSVSGPHDITRHGNVKADRATIHCDYAVATFSSGERRRSTRGSRQAIETGLLIANTFESVILVEQFPRSQIDICIQVIQGDGGLLNAAINATTLALIDAGIPLKDFLVSCSASWIEGTTLCDLNYMEESAQGCCKLPIALLPKTDKVAMMQTDEIVELDRLKDVLEMASKGCHLIHDIMLREVREYKIQLVEARGSVLF